MSYRCFLCSQSVPVGTACLKRVLQTRVKHYPEREHSKREWRLVKGRWKKVWIPDPGGVGLEIVKEANCCPHCAAELDNANRVSSR